MLGPGQGWGAICPVHWGGIVMETGWAFTILGLLSAPKSFLLRDLLLV